MKWIPFLLAMAAVLALIGIGRELRGIRYQMTLLACVQMAKSGATCAAAQKGPVNG